MSSDAGTDPIGNPSGNAVSYALNYDPGWNTYMASDGKTPKEQDMAAVFAPSDNKLYEYFFAENGGGRFLLEAYAPDLIGSVRGETDYENIVVVKPDGTPGSTEDIIQTLTLQAAQAAGVVFSLSFDQIAEAKEKLKQALEDAKEKIENVLNNTNSVQTQSVQSAATTQSVLKKTNVTFD